MFGLSKFEKRLKALEDTCERIERASKKLEIEWTDTYDKFRQLHMRVAKRVHQLEQAPETEATETREATPSPPDSHGLSPRQAEINAEILARRNRKPVAPRSGGE